MGSQKTSAEIKQTKAEQSKIMVLLGEAKGGEADRLYAMLNPANKMKYNRDIRIRYQKGEAKLALLETKHGAREANAGGLLAENKALKKQLDEFEKQVAKASSKAGGLRNVKLMGFPDVDYTQPHVVMKWSRKATGDSDPTPAHGKMFVNVKGRGKVVFDFKHGHCVTNDLAGAKAAALSGKGIGVEYMTKKPGIDDMDNKVTGFIETPDKERESAFPPDVDDDSDDGVVNKQDVDAFLDDSED